VTKTDTNIPDLLSQAHQHLDAQRLEVAERLYHQVLQLEPENPEALKKLVVIALQSNQLNTAEKYLARLVSAFPLEPSYCDHYAGILMRQDKAQLAIAAYERLLELAPKFIDSRYNFARLLKQARKPEQALEQYQLGLEQGISNPAQVHTNMSVIHTEQGRDDAARESLQLALSENDEYIPALYNLALLEEEHGSIDKARELFEQILVLDSHHVNAMVRLAYCQRFTEAEPLLERRLKHALAQSSDTGLAKENINYALGKLADDCGQYSQAFEYFQAANKRGSARSASYDPTAQGLLREQLQASSKIVIEPVSEQPLLFICGMFRSGSTLLEQMLAAHPDLTAGGEIGFFREHAPLPAALTSTSSEFHQLGTDYLSRLAQVGADTSRITNKRPDSFLHLGIILKLFPNARVLNTTRHPLDNALSIYTQPFEAEVDYDNSLLEIGHYYYQYRLLMQHWGEQYPENIQDVAYEQLVLEPRAAMEEVLEFLDLPWSDQCLEYHQLENRVRTASVWQVRQPLYRQSLDRREHYSNELKELAEYFANFRITRD
jgi:tetratricopeptide (TPR) repeat protein